MGNLMLEEIGRQLQEAKRVAVVSHIRPDGDAVGSLLGLGLSLMEAGKDVQMVLADRVPLTFQHLTGSDKIVGQAEGDYDIVVILDCSDFERVGSALPSHSQPDINIDHHITNLNFAKRNLVDVKSVATAEIIARSLPVWDLPLAPGSADALLTGMITDTIGFRTANVSAEALRVAADLVEAGAKMPELYKRALSQKSYSAARYWGSGLCKLRQDGGIVWTTLTLAERIKVGYPGRDDADLINMISFLDGTEVALIFIEQPEGKVKVSWRSQTDKDVSQVALQFGGGGHRAAAGAEILGAIDEVTARVLDATRSLFLTREVKI